MENDFVKADSSNLPKVDFEMIHQFYLKNQNYVSAEGRGQKDVKSGRSSYGDAIGYVQLKRSDYIVTVKARVTPEHKVSSKNYNVTVRINEDHEDIVESQCHDCVASLGGCKHALAILYWLHRRTEEPSVTSVKCYWTKPKLSQVTKNISKIADMFPEKIQCNLSEPNGEFRKEIVNLFKENVVDCILVNTVQCKLTVNISLHDLIIKYIDCSGPNEAQHFISYAECWMEAEENLGKIEQETIPQRESHLWHELRYARITASKFHDISKCQTGQGTLLQSVMGGYKKIDNPAMQRGRKLENEVLDLVSKEHNIVVKKCGLFLDPAFPIFAASPDTINETHTFEVKCPMKEKTVKNYLTNGKITQKYYGQCLLQMRLSKKSKCFFIVADPQFESNRQYEIVEVNYSSTDFDMLAKQSVEYWKANVFPLLFNIKQAL